MQLGKQTRLGWGAEELQRDRLGGFKADGALTATNVFVINSLECPMGWYGPNCQEQCACEHTCPCDRETGSCNITYEPAVQEQLNKGTSDYSTCVLKNKLGEQLRCIVFCLLSYQLCLAVTLPNFSFLVEFYTFPPPMPFFLLCFPAGRCLASQNKGRSKEKFSLSE